KQCETGDPVTQRMRRERRPPVVEKPMWTPTPVASSAALSGASCGFWVAAMAVLRDQLPPRDAPGRFIVLPSTGAAAFASTGSVAAPVARGIIAHPRWQTG